MALECTLAGLANVDQTDPDAVQALLRQCISTLLDPTLWGWVLLLTLVCALIGAVIGWAKGRWLAGFGAAWDRSAGSSLRFRSRACANVPNAGGATSRMRKSAVTAASIFANMQARARDRASRPRIARAAGEVLHLIAACTGAISFDDAPGRRG